MESDFQWICYLLWKIHRGNSIAATQGTCISEKKFLLCSAQLSKAGEKIHICRRKNLLQTDNAFKNILFIIDWNLINILYMNSKFNTFKLFIVKMVMKCEYLLKIGWRYVIYTSYISYIWVCIHDYQVSISLSLMYFWLEIFHINVAAVPCLVTQSCPALWDPMDCSLPGYSACLDSQSKNTIVLCCPPGDLPNPEIEPRSLTLQVDS